MSKPRIVKVPTLPLQYRCTGGVGHYKAEGFGVTPLQSYESYKAIMYNLIKMGKLP